MYVLVHVNIPVINHSVGKLFIMYFFKSNVLTILECVICLVINDSFRYITENVCLKLSRMNTKCV